MTHDATALVRTRRPIIREFYLLAFSDTSTKGKVMGDMSIALRAMLRETTLLVGREYTV